MDLLENPKPRGSQAHYESRVLLIAHDRHCEEGLEQELTRLQCSFAHTAGSADTLRRLRHTPFAVVVTDPETSIHENLALVEEIRHVRSRVRVIVLAPSGAPEDLIAALRQRVFLCQCAPFNARETARYVVSAIEADNAHSGIEVLSADREWITVRMHCDLLNADRLTAFFKQFQMTLPRRPPEEMMIAFEEILHNAIEHGAQNDPSKQLEVAAVQTARAFVFYISDPGKGFRTDAIPHAAISYPLDHLTDHLQVRRSQGMRPGGYGILLASGLVDELIYSEVGNEVLLIKHMLGFDPRRSDLEESWITGRGGPS